jgi:hypothetical protein
VQEERGLRRRLVALGLGRTPGDLRAAAVVHPVKISQVLDGAARLAPSEAAGIARLAGRRRAQMANDSSAGFAGLSQERSDLPGGPAEGRVESAREGA